MGLEFGYSSSINALQHDKCDVFQICNTKADNNSPMRELYNRLVRITNIDKLRKDSTIEYKASCEWLKLLERQRTEMKSELLQHYVLVLFYYATNGDSWYDKTSWLSKKSFCSWYGISCDAYNIVTEINLSLNNLRGFIPTEIGGLRG